MKSIRYMFIMICLYKTILTQIPYAAAAAGDAAAGAVRHLALDGPI